MLRGQDGAADNKRRIQQRMLAMFSCLHEPRNAGDTVHNVGHLEDERGVRHGTEEHSGLEGQAVGDGRHSDDRRWIHRRHDVCQAV